MIASNHDCEVIIVRGMGRGAYLAMEQANIRPFVTDHTEFINAVRGDWGGQEVALEGVDTGITVDSLNLGPIRSLHYRRIRLILRQGIRSKMVTCLARRCKVIMVVFCRVKQRRLLNKVS
jgi:hypothetical protein